MPEYCMVFPRKREKCTGHIMIENSSGFIDSFFKGIDNEESQALLDEMKQALEQMEETETTKRFKEVARKVAPKITTAEKFELQ